MTLLSFVLLVLAGVGAGAVGYLTGMASLVSYPAMLAAGLPPVAANVSQTLGLIGIGAGAAVRQAPVLMERGRRDLAVQLVLAGIGGGIGATVLLVGGEGAFRLVVPWLIMLASVMVLVSPRLKTMQGSRVAPRWAYLASVLVVSAYGGYFGAGAGTIYLAVALLVGPDGFGRTMLLKSVLLGVTNLVAAVIFALVAPVHWLAALALGVGCVAGGHLGASVQEHVSERVIRVVVAVAGIGLALWLALGKG